MEAPSSNEAVVLKSAGVVVGVAAVLLLLAVLTTPTEND